MAILLDSSAVLAAADQSDLNHRAALAWFGQVNEPLMIGALTLAELDLPPAAGAGPESHVCAAQSQSAAVPSKVVAPSTADLVRATELMRETMEYRPRLTDAVLVATAERLGVTRVAAFDRRPIAIFRPKHVRAFDLEP